MRCLVTIVVSLLAAAGCAQPPPRATAADALRANVTLAQLEHGRTLLIEKCGRCHTAPHPKQYRAADWPHEVAEMEERSQIDPAQRQAIELYLTTMAAAPAGR